jgi:hypothetical protein
VTCDVPLIPNVILFEFTKFTVPLVAVCVPAPMAPIARMSALKLAVIMLELLIPNVMPFEFAKESVPPVKDWVPATMTSFGVTDAVTTEPFRPNEIPLLFEKVTALRLFEVVPAEILKLYDAVICEDPLIPNVMLFEFE